MDINKSEDNIRLLEKLKGYRNDIVNSIEFKPLKSFLIVVIGLSFTDGLFGTYFNFNQVILEFYNIDSAVIAMFFSIIYSVSAVEYQVAYYLRKRFKVSRIIIMNFIILSVIYLSIYTMDNSVIIILLSLLGAFLPEVNYILVDEFVQRGIKSKNRATILSFVSLITSLSSVIFYQLFGLISGVYTIKIIILIMSVLSVLVLPSYHLMKKNLKVY